jgi:hypothetical protein
VAAEEPPSGWRLALDAAVVRRALLMALVVGPILILINHVDAILQGEIGPVRALKMALTMAIPYLVSTYSSVGALRRQG